MSAKRRWLRIVLGIVAVVGVVVYLPLPLGVTVVRSEADIARSPRDVFEYVTTPGNWPSWHPSSLAVQGDVNHSLAVGETVTEEFRVAGQHGFANWRVVSSEPDRLWKIEGTIDGRVAGFVTYTLTANGDATHFVRVFEYPSRTIVFAIVNAVVLRSRIIEESTQAVTNLKAVLEPRR